MWVRIDKLQLKAWVDQRVLLLGCECRGARRHKERGERTIERWSTPQTSAMGLGQRERLLVRVVFHDSQL